MSQTPEWFERMLDNVGRYTASYVFDAEQDSKDAWELVKAHPRGLGVWRSYIRNVHPRVWVVSVLAESRGDLQRACTLLERLGGRPHSLDERTLEALRARRKALAREMFTSGKLGRLAVYRNEPHIINPLTGEKIPYEEED